MCNFFFMLWCITAVLFSSLFDVESGQWAETTVKAFERSYETTWNWSTSASKLWERHKESARKIRVWRENSQAGRSLLSCTIYDRALLRLFAIWVTLYAACGLHGGALQCYRSVYHGLWKKITNIVTGGMLSWSPRVRQHHHWVFRRCWMGDRNDLKYCHCHVNSHLKVTYLHTYIQKFITRNIVKHV